MIPTPGEKAYMQREDKTEPLSLQVYRKSDITYSKIIVTGISPFTGCITGYAYGSKRGKILLQVKWDDTLREWVIILESPKP